MIKQNQKILNALLAFLDACLCIISILLAFALHFLDNEYIPPIGIWFYLQLMIVVIPVYFILYNYFGLHDSFRHQSLLTETGKIIQANIIGILFIFILSFILKQVHISRMVVILFAILNAALSSFCRIGLRLLLRRLRSKGYNLKHILLIGWNEVTAEFYDRLSANRNLGYDFMGYLSEEQKNTAGRGVVYAGDFTCLPMLLERKGVDEVVISLEFNEFHQLEGIIDTCEKAGVKSTLLPFYMKYLPSRPFIDEVEGIPLINIRKIPLDNLLNTLEKRSFDLVCSLVGLAIVSPILLISAIGIKLTSPGPVIYRQQRIGRNKKPFNMYKLRSMKMEKNGSDMTTWGTSDDDRRTRFGSFLRKCSIDELPQLFNVLKGDMSLVGPRPERPFFVEKFREEIPLYMLKHLVRPGITGWAQVNGWRGDTSIEERIKCDIYYIENWSFLLDLKILIMTALNGFWNRSEKI